MVIVGTFLVLWGTVTGRDQGMATAAGYLSMYFVTDPGEPAALPLRILLGIGQTACNISAQALVGQEATDEIRGVVIVLSALLCIFSLLVRRGSSPVPQFNC